YAGKRLHVAPHRRFALLFLWLTGIIVAVAYLFNVYLAPQPHRYHQEVEMAFCLLVAFLLQGALGGAAPPGPSRPPGRLSGAQEGGDKGWPGGQPQPGGAAPQTILSFCSLLDAIPPPARRRVLVVAGALALVAAAAQSVHAYGFAARLLQPMDVTTRIEYRVAKFMSERFGTRRVMP